MILVIGTIRVPADNLDGAMAAAETVITATRREDGCIRYAYARDLIDPDIMHISEAWRDRAALAAHARTPHVAEWHRVVSALGVTGRDLKIYETDEGEAI